KSCRKLKSGKAELAALSRLIPLFSCHNRHFPRMRLLRGCRTGVPASRTSTLFSKRDTLMCRTFRIFALLIISLVAAAPATAQDAPSLKIKETAVIDRLGDGKFELEVKLPAVLYTQYKASNPNTALLLRRIGLSPGQWLELEGVKSSFVDGNSSVHFEW